MMTNEKFVFLANEEIKEKCEQENNSEDTLKWRMIEHSFIHEPRPVAVLLPVV